MSSRMTTPDRTAAAPAGRLLRVPDDAAAAAAVVEGSRSAFRPVLARDADATYWMARYVERAEHVARLLLVSSEHLTDVSDVAAGLVARHWESVPQILGGGPPPSGDTPLPQRVAEHMTFDQNNPNSLIRCLTRARENARGIREVISAEMWEHLNTLYWSVRAEETLAAFKETPDQLYRQIIAGSMLFQGLADQTLMHGQRWHFTRLGKYFERIGVTCRILKARTGMLGDAGTAAADTPLWNIHWTTVLRSCSSIEAYRRAHLGELDPVLVARFLLLEGEFPRSVRYCVREAHEAIAAIRQSVRPRAADPTERVLGRLAARLEYAEPGDVGSEQGLHALLDQILSDITQAALAVQRSFFLH